MRPKNWRTALQNSFMPFVAGLVEHTPSLWSEPAELAASFLCAPRCPLVWAALLLKSDLCTSWHHSPLYAHSPAPLLLLGPPRPASAWWGSGLTDASREPGSRAPVTLFPLSLPLLLLVRVLLAAPPWWTSSLPFSLPLCLSVHRQADVHPRMHTDLLDVAAECQQDPQLNGFFFVSGFPSPENYFNWCFSVPFPILFKD